MVNKNLLEKISDGDLRKKTTANNVGYTDDCIHFSHLILFESRNN